MSTLSNVDPNEDKAVPQCVGFTPDSIPDAKSSQTGVSVRYVPSAEKSWFVLRVSYGRVQKASDFLVENGTFTYLPLHYVRKEINGKRRRVLEPLVPSLLFVYSTADDVENFVKQTPQLPYLSYYYDHFSITEGKNPPLTVPPAAMKNFIRATSTSSEHMRLVNPAKCSFKGGELVEIIDGEFVGVKGRVARIAGQQRVVVTIQVCTVATAYIPTAFLRRIDAVVSD